jgi:hypothetical protein
VLLLAQVVAEFFIVRSDTDLQGLVGLLNRRIPDRGDLFNWSSPNERIDASAPQNDWTTFVIAVAGMGISAVMTDTATTPYQERNQGRLHERENLMSYVYWYSNPGNGV